MTKLSRIQNYVLYLLSAQTHPDVELKNFALTATSEEQLTVIDELVNLGLVKVINNIASLTKEGIAALPQPQPELTDVLRNIKQALPKNPKFGVIVEALSDAALIGLFYEILGEIGERGNPDNEKAYTFWQSKITEFNKVLENATPDSLYERRQKQMQFFGTDEKVKKSKKV